MADVAVENEATAVAPAVEKEVEDVAAATKVAADKTEVVNNGAAKVGDETAEAVPAPAVASENGEKTLAADEAVAAGDVAAAETTKPAESSEESAPAVDKVAETGADAEHKNGNSTDAPAEAVKRKVNDDAEETPAADTAESIPEKKAKIAAEKEAEANGEATKEEVAA